MSIFIKFFLFNITGVDSFVRDMVQDACHIVIIATRNRPVLSGLWLSLPYRQDTISALWTGAQTRPETVWNKVLCQLISFIWMDYHVEDA
jgi:hypothetical protein